jgi:hypothetical protein
MINFVLEIDETRQRDWARVVGYGSFSFCVIHQEGLCPSSEDINRLMMMIIDKILDVNKNTFLCK